MNDFASFIGELFNVISDFLLNSPAKYVLFIFLFLSIVGIIIKLIRR